MLTSTLRSAVDSTTYKTPTPPGTSGSGRPAPPSNSASIQESNVALQKIIASSFKNAFCIVLHENSQGYEGNANLALTNAFCVLHDVDTNTEAAIPVDPNTLHRYNDIVANPEIAYDIIFAGLLSLRLEWKQTTS
jgi:hypothetical protein